MWPHLAQSCCKIHGMWYIISCFFLGPTHRLSIQMTLSLSPLLWVMTSVPRTIIDTQRPMSSTRQGISDHSPLPHPFRSPLPLTGFGREGWLAQRGARGESEEMLKQHWVTSQKHWWVEHGLCSLYVFLSFSVIVNTLSTGVYSFNTELCLFYLFVLFI